MPVSRQKELGAYYTPEPVVQSLVHWAVRKASDLLLDPACGDGRFLATHANSVGVEQDADASATVHQRAPKAAIHYGDFFSWAKDTHERFDCAAGNPPFIRYQRFNGTVRKTALEVCASHGASFSGLSSSWAPFLVATASLLKPGGRLAFVVPAEIGHAPYAQPVLSYMARHFETVQVIAIERKVFPELSEDCWLLYCAGFGGQSNHLLLSLMTQFGYMRSPPKTDVEISLEEWRRWNCRLRPFLLSPHARHLYERLSRCNSAARLGNLARVGIGYVTGANDFFHLRPSEAEARGIPEKYLQPTVRNAKALTGQAVTKSTVQKWCRRDDAVLLLRLRAGADLPRAVRDYLESPAGQTARTGYKCRNRNPWYVVPDVRIPDAFLTYMSGNEPALVANRARCAATNSMHVIDLKGNVSVTELQKMWRHPLTQLSCEIEGHPLGGGILKIEPREASRVVLLDNGKMSREKMALIREGIRTLRRWRHYG